MSAGNELKEKCNFPFEHVWKKQCTPKTIK